MTDMPAAGSWQAFHLYYHGDQDLVLRKLARPLIGELARSGDLDAFFFVRYRVGGPHLRLRLRTRPETREPVARHVELEIDRFLHRHPSASSLDPDTLRRQTERLIRHDPHEDDDAIYPDNSLRRVPFQPETARYGGPERLPLSLACFTLSSVRVLRLLEELAEAPASRRLPHQLAVLTAQAWGFAGDREDLQALLEWGLTGWGKAMEPIVERGDQVYEKSPEVFQSLLRQVLESVRSEPPEDVRGSRLLRHGLSTATREERLRITSSHIHMTANRLGLRNPDEVYLSRLMSRALEDLTTSPSRFREELEAHLVEQETAPGAVAERLESLARESLVRL